MVQDRRSFWLYIQENILKFFQLTLSIVITLNTYEIYDLLVLSNKFIEIGIEFSGDESEKSQTLLRFIAKEMTLKYITEFNNNQNVNIKNILEREEWNRLPLPDNF